MENINIKEQSKASKVHLEIYVKNQMQWYKFIAAEKLAKFGSFIFVGFFLSLIAMLFITLLSIAIALFLGEILNNYSLAFLLVSFAYVILGLTLFFVRKAIFRNPLLRTIIQEL